MTVQRYQRNDALWLKEQLSPALWKMGWSNSATRVLQIAREMQAALAAGSGTAKTPQAVECEASQSGHRPKSTGVTR